METFLRDLRYGARSLLRTPGFTAAAVFALALGIGAATSIFSVLDGVVLRPLAFAQPQRLYRLAEVDPHGEKGPWSPGNFLDAQRDTQAFEAMAGLQHAMMNLYARGEPEKVRAMRVSPTLFAAVLRVTPALGRTFTAEDDLPQSAPTVVLSDELWRKRFLADPDVPGKTVLLDGLTYTVVGVLPRGMQLPTRSSNPEAYVTFRWSEAEARKRGSHSFDVIGRLKPGVTEAQAQADLDRCAARAAERDRDNTQWKETLTPLQQSMVGRQRPALEALLGASGLVLLIACANVASMLLARGAARQREIAIRSALGGARSQIIRQLLTESLLLGLLGGTLGLLLATWAIDGLVALGPRDLPRLAEVALNARVAAFAVLVSIATGLLAGLVPALSGSRTDLLEALKSGTAQTGGHGRAREALVVAEIALALVLVLSAGLLVRSFQRLTSQELGFRSDGVLMANMELPLGKYPEPRQASDFYRRLLERVGALPGVQSVSAASAVPLESSFSFSSFHLAGTPEKPSELADVTWVDWVMPGYFKTLRMPLLRGRDLSLDDRAGAPGAMLVNEAWVKKFSPGQEVLGRRLDDFVGDGRFAWEIVGVVGDTRARALDAAPEPHAYVSAMQDPGPGLRLLVRTDGDFGALTQALRAEVQRLDAQQPLSQVTPLEQIVAGSVGQRRFQLLLVLLFAAVALLLAAVGIYGVMAYTVAQRTQEIGIRMALGANAGSVLRLIVGRVLRLAGLGIAVGICGALLSARLLAAFLFGISPTDPLTYVAIAFLLASVAALAGFLPARRATAVDPMVALRTE